MKRLSLIIIVLLGVSLIGFAGNNGPGKKRDFIKVKNDYEKYIVKLEKTGGTQAVNNKSSYKHVYSRKYQKLMQKKRFTPFTIAQKKYKKPVNSYKFNWD